jgi:2-amino-4-hydroxy-6-hydroxymethyldihydropteridine diphosphokinase
MRARLAQAAVALGSNIPPRRQFLSRALGLMNRAAGIRVLSLSRVYETEPEGGARQGPYLNAAALIETVLPPEFLLNEVERIEKKMGRTGKGLGESRTIDIDIILYDQEQVDRPGLMIPHPRFRERGFVLQPLADIIPRFVDPVTKRTVADLLRGWIRDGGHPVDGRRIELEPFKPNQG